MSWFTNRLNKENIQVHVHVHTYIRKRRKYSAVSRSCCNRLPLERRHFILSLDAEKTFDQIEWPNMFETLQRFGFGDSFIAWVKMLYLCPTSSILYSNNDRSGPFDFKPLAIGIRSHPDVRGIKIEDLESRVSVYANDTLNTLNHLASSLATQLNGVRASSCPYWAIGL